MNGQIVLVIAVLLAVGFGLWRWFTDGRVRDAAADTVPGIPLGRTATFVQFSSAVCSPCATTRRILADFAQDDDIDHVEFDVEHHMALVERFDVTRTPTVLVLDGSGTVRHRIVGVPRITELKVALEQNLRTA